MFSWPMGVKCGVEKAEAMFSTTFPLQKTSTPPAHARFTACDEDEGEAEEFDLHSRPSSGPKLQAQATTSL